jgi:hypothetical protein
LFFGGHGEDRCQVFKSLGFRVVQVVGLAGSRAASSAASGWWRQNRFHPTPAFPPCFHVVESRDGCHAAFLEKSNLRDSKLENLPA